KKKYDAPSPAPSIRSSSRLAAKPRRTHCLTARVRCTPIQPDCLPTAEGGDRSGKPAVSSETSQKAASAAPPAEDALLCHRGVRERRYSCSSCGKRFFQVGHLKKHQFNFLTCKALSLQLSHRGERPFSCSHCEKTYGLKRDLKEHMVLHTGEKPYICEQCGKAFARNLECHLRIHSGVKPFSCSECNQSFSQKPDLQRHMLSHTGGGFLCSYCGKSLRDPHSLRSHERLEICSAILACCAIHPHK
uniref:C2H2-type domain-containing protein n=1 Tax=Oryzias latipes TaxID=8090 RepID=A0A3B3HP15_ORYLA